MEKLKNADSLFVGRFMIVAKKENEISDRQTGEVTKYWEYSLSNGKDTPFQLIALCLIVDYVVWAIYQIFMNKNSKKGGS